ncbi:MAG: glutathione S-transferase family protein [Pseudomonadaceae bacterium]|nr:glutathione S-transferase family protein [Pseudomonadaceae bacterium]
MGQLIKGQWQAEDLPRHQADGRFKRPNSTFRDWIGAPDGRYPAAPGRYHLFVNAGCPWAYRTILYRSIKNLDDVVSLSRTAAAAGDQGWHFDNPPEPLLQVEHLHEVYSHADPAFTGRVTVPVLWDTHSNTIVNNESADIMRMFNDAFNGIEGVSQTDYYPETLRTEIEALNQVIYTDVNNGVYRCGFAQSQSAYEEAYDNLFNTLDKLDDRLAVRRYLFGNQVTETDWRLFSTLIRFDLAYYSRFKCNRNQLLDFEHLWPYTRDLYQLPGVAETVDVSAIKGIYYGAGKPGILPKGPQLDFSAPHNRDAIQL